MTVIQMSTHARKASVARVEQMAADHAAFQRTKAQEAENDSQRRIHIAALDHVISAAWAAPTLGPDMTAKAILTIFERLVAGDGRPFVTTLRDNLELITAGKE
jgi:hypothetical protein